MSGQALMEDQALELMALLRSGSNDTVKIERVIAAKGQIKHQSIQLEAIPLVFSALRIGIASSNNTLFQHCFSCLGHLVKRVKNQDPTQLRRQAGDILPILVDRMGDSKEKIRDLALNPLVDMYTACPAEVEKMIREYGLASKNPRLKESSLEWLSRVHRQSPDLSIKPFTGIVVSLLEDADGGVREKAKATVVELFQFASGPAKADLIKAMQTQGVRKAISAYIIDRINDVDFRSSAQSRSESRQGNDPQPPTKEFAKLSTKTTNKVSPTSTYLSTLPGVELEEIKPAYINTSRELDHELNEMLPAFEGRESEGNWAAREKNVSRLRELLRGNAPAEHEHIFLAGIKSLTDGIVKASTSLRTKLSTSGCQLLKDLFLICGPGMDPMVDILLPALIKLCAGTKKITAEAGNVTTAILFAKVSYHTKIVNQLWLACQDKNVQPRQFATGWLRALLEAHAGQKSLIEHGEGIITIEKCLRKGITDANPGVREGMRVTFWRFHAMWPQRADVIFEEQDGNTKKLLEKDNPNGADANKVAKPALGRSTTGPPARPSMKELLAQKRRDAAMPKLETAQSFAGPFTQTPVAHTPAAPEKSGLSSAPLRPARVMPVRPKSQMSARIEAPQRPASVSSNGESHGGPEKNAPSLANARSSSPSSSTAKSSSALSPRGLTRTNGRQSPTVMSPSSIPRPGLQKSPLSRSTRKLTILEQLNHPDPKVKLEGIVVMGCLLAKRTPPNYEPGMKMPSLPGSDQLAQSLQNLINDPNQEVVENVLAPEMLGELVKYVGFDQIVPKVLLLNEGETEHPRPDPTSSLVTLKTLLTKEEAAEFLLRVITTTGTSGNAYKMAVPPGAKHTAFTVPQKRKILHGALLWMNELVNDVLDGRQNEFLCQTKVFKTLIDRLIPMFHQAKPPNDKLLVNLLQGLHEVNEEAFGNRLATFDNQIVRELRKAWGMTLEDTPVHEEVADVRQVLGVEPSFVQMGPPPKPKGQSFFGEDEELTMINPLAMLREEKERSQEMDLLSNRPRTADKDSIIKVYQDPVQDSEDGIRTPVVDRTLPPPATTGRPKPKGVTSTGKSIEPQSRVLQTLIRKTKSGEIDINGLKKLLGVVRDNPVRTALQESNGDGMVHSDIWEGGKVFQELLDALLKNLGDASKDPAMSADLRSQALLVLKQLLGRASPYFRGHEYDIYPTLIRLRGLYPTNSQVSTNIEEAVDEFHNIADTQNSISAILSQILNSHSVMRPLSSVLALNTLANLLKSVKVPLILEPNWGKLGTVAVRTMDDEEPEVRKAAVAMCVEMRERLGNDDRLFSDYLAGLSEGHKGLLKYYFK